METWQQNHQPTMVAVRAAFLLFVACAGSVAAVGPAGEEQIHLSFVNSSSLVIDFVSPHGTVWVRWGPSASSERHVQPATTGRFFQPVGFMTTAALHGLVPGEAYVYAFGLNSSTFGSEYTFSHVSAHNRTSNPVVAVMADFGIVNDVSMASLLEATAQGAIDMIQIHGDIAYDMDTNNSQVGSEFLRVLQPATSQVPLMVSIGNHDVKDNCTNYCLRFNGTAVGAGARSHSRTNMFYSYDFGLTHFIHLNSEQFFFSNQTAASPYPFTHAEQLAWLEADLVAANANRGNVPWIVVGIHKPWYVDYTIHRHKYYEPIGNFSGFNALLVEYKADLVLAGHVHLYRRFYPLNGPAKLAAAAPVQALDKDCASEVDGVAFYTNPQFPTTIVVGSPGDQEETSAGMCIGYPILDPAMDGTSAVCAAEYGFGRLQALNSTHLHWKWEVTGPPSSADLISNDELYIVRSL